MGARKFGMSFAFEAQGNQTSWQAIPDFAGISRGRPKNLRKKGSCSIFVPYQECAVGRVGDVLPIAGEHFGSNIFIAAVNNMPVATVKLDGSARTRVAEPSLQACCQPRAPLTLVARGIGRLLIAHLHCQLALLALFHRQR